MYKTLEQAQKRQAQVRHEQTVHKIALLGYLISSGVMIVCLLIGLIIKV
jgi:hypothetical protein